jgi:hypothetical protein
VSEEDKETFKQARSYIVGVVALAIALRRGDPPPFNIEFDHAEAFVAEFEKRNEI